MTVGKPNPSYSKVQQWCKEYGRSDIPDNRGCQDFIDCESGELVRSLQAELLAMAEGRYQNAILDQIVGVRRKAQHGSYQEWARMMLRWLAAHRS